MTCRSGLPFLNGCSPLPSVVEPAGIAQALVKWPRWPSNMASWRDDLGEKLRARSQEMAHRPIGLAVKALGRPVAEERMARGLAHNDVSEWDHRLEGDYGARDGALAPAPLGEGSSVGCRDDAPPRLGSSAATTAAGGKRKVTTYSSGEEDEEDDGRAYVKTAVAAPLTDAGASAVCVDGGADEIRQRGDDVDEDDDAHVNEKKTVRRRAARRPEVKGVRNDIRTLRLHTRKPCNNNSPSALVKNGWTVWASPSTMKPLRALMQVSRVQSRHQCMFVSSRSKTSPLAYLARR